MSIHSEARRSTIAAGVGLIVGAGSARFVAWQLSSLIGWDTAVFVLLVWIWRETWQLDADSTARVAVREDDSRNATRLLILFAATASLAGVVLAFVKSKQVDGMEFGLLTASVLVTVVGSWLLTHTLFALRYADLYYQDPVGGIDFVPSSRMPDYHDFGYVAFTVGMTFQVSDTDISDPDIRRAVLRQALLSYLFGTVIVALTINIVAGLVR